MQFFVSLFGKLFSKYLEQDKLRLFLEFFQHHPAQISLVDFELGQYKFYVHFAPYEGNKVLRNKLKSSSAQARIPSHSGFGAKSLSWSSWLRKIDLITQATCDLCPK